jgi:hypothetical protein
MGIRRADERTRTADLLITSDNSRGARGSPVVQNVCKGALIYLQLPSATSSPTLPVVSDWYQKTRGYRAFIGPIGLGLCRILHAKFGDLPFRDCPKSPGPTCSVALRGAKEEFWGPFRPPYTSQFHDRSVARTTLRTVSRHWCENSLGGSSFS